uniref:Glycogen synthase n=1 Tax=Magnetococcus massalia (strain MO-1) TaxID=451514 RepID=A0A1S7LGK9_MAGMO|nr:GT5 : glycogen/starch synthases, ADP-glucose [Candidatus Magnetococcus massalia]
MYTVMVASECAPVAKVGGLADVVHGLSRELQAQDQQVEIILPKYACLRWDLIENPRIAYEHLWVPWSGGAIHTTVWSGQLDGLDCFFIDPHSEENFFGRENFYGYLDEAPRFAFFTKAALEFLLHSGRRPDILHTHDWQTSLAAVMLYEMFAEQKMGEIRVCHTIHNFKHQGICGHELLEMTGLDRPDYYGARDRLGDDFHKEALNFTKGALLYANFITTVSRNHAWEVRHSDQNYGLGHPLYLHQDKFGGVVNGLDYNAWNPATDLQIHQHFDLEHMEQKQANKVWLRDRLLLAQDEKPLIAYVGRLDPQKGVHLIKHALVHALNNDAQFVLLGSGSEEAINHEFIDLKNHFNDNPNCHIEVGFHEGLARQIYAGADLMVVPSMFEPCGLTQLISLRYGTVPVVRAVGGLVDTVFDWHHDNHPQGMRNGFIFNDANYAGLESALDRAIGLWRDDPDEFHLLMKNGMRMDFSWHEPTRHYLNIYRFIRHK